jgi:hypothetical protein
LTSIAAAEFARPGWWAGVAIPDAPRLASAKPKEDLNVIEGRSW